MASVLSNTPLHPYEVPSQIKWYHLKLHLWECCILSLRWNLHQIFERRLGRVCEIKWNYLQVNLNADVTEMIIRWRGARWGGEKCKRGTEAKQLQKWHQTIILMFAFNVNGPCLMVRQIIWKAKRWWQQTPNMTIAPGENKKQKNR